MKVIATMIVRDEDDVIQETIDEISEYTKDIIILDGGSEDKTIDIIKQYSYVELHQTKSGTNWDHAGERNFLLDLARQRNPDWVITVDADEIYHTNPIRAIEFADQEGATLICCSIPQFHFTEKELLDGTLQNESEMTYVQDRRKYYSWGWEDYMIFKMQEGLTYLGGKNGRITRPPYFTGPAQLIKSKAKPILKHYQYRSLKQYAKKMKTRRRNCGDNYKRWFKWTYDNPFYNEDSLNVFDGTFMDGKKCRIPDENWV